MLIDFLKNNQNLIFLISGLVLNIVGFILSKPIQKKVVAIVTNALKYNSGYSKKYQKLEKNGGGVEYRIFYSWGGIIVFIIGLLQTIISIIIMIN